MRYLFAGSVNTSKYAFLLPINCPILLSTVQAPSYDPFPHKHKVQSNDEEAS